ncbi:MAG: restriction endonuclease subunit S [Clostridiales bacterium]|nr:restriction endonuclease subunit S [Clostridiales bacterium]
MAKKTVEKASPFVPVEEQPYQVPENWCWVIIGKITDIIGGGTPPSGMATYYEGGTIPWITPADLSDYNEVYISRGKKMITELGLEKSSAKMLPTGTVCLSSRAPIGYVAIAKNQLSTNQGFKSFLPSKCYLPQYLYWYLKGNKELLESKASGTTFLELSGKKAAQLPFPIAPLPEQKRIVDRIESLFAKLDEAKEKVQAALGSFETRKAAVLQSAFNGHLTENWRHNNGISISTWDKTTIGNISVLITKGASPKWQGVSYTTDKSQTLFITSENVREGYLDLEKEKYLDNKINEIQARSVLCYGDVLLNIVGASIGRSAIFDRHQLANTNLAVCIIRLKDGIENRFISYFLNSPFAQYFYSDKKVEVARANISLGDIKLMPISLPTKDEQFEIVRLLDAFFDKEAEAKAQAEAALKSIDAMKKSILAKAFRGELGTNHPEDESAEELLKRTLA